MLDDLLSGLGYLGESLDKPGRAIRGLIAGRPDEAAAIVPFSDSMGLTDPANRTSGRDLLRALGADPGSGLGGDVAGFAAEVATDPLTWIGAGLGTRLGSKAATAAAGRGPRYGTTVGDIEATIFDSIGGGRASNAARQRLEDLRSAPPEVMDRLLQEVPTGSNYLGAGAEGIALRTPAGDVVRLGQVPRGDLGRPLAEGVLAPTRTLDVPIPSSSPRFQSAWRAERIPFAEKIPDAQMRPAYEDLVQTLERQGIHFGDAHSGNMAMYRGQPTVIDPGAIDLNYKMAPLPGEAAYTGRFARTAEAAEPSALMRALIGFGGGDEAVRQALNRGRFAPDFASPFGFLGAGLGANVGAFSRQA